ncbi:hypothetical protein [Acinetobacter sp. WZC-1]|uniref:hypothetical protein n=1 Tax=Acinetobacter sp. WZC-1 TaxID=3459034 RepID=UPI00403DAE2F
MNKLKEHRIINRMLDSIFQAKAFVKINTFDDIKNLECIISQELKLSSNKSMYMTLATRKIMVEVTEKLLIYYELQDAITFSELYSVVKRHYENRLSLSEDNKNMIEEIHSKAKKEIKNFNYIACCEGISFEEVGFLDCGNYRVIQSDEDIFRRAYGKDDVNFFNRMNKYLWIQGKEIGSQKKSAEKFHYISNILTGFIGVCTQTINERLILDYRIQVLNSFSGQKISSPSLSWLDEKEGGTFLYDSINFREIKLTSEIINYFNNNLFFNNFFQALQKDSQNEIEEAVIKAVYWFSEATKDNNNTMKFIKLWSCVECFFSIGKESISESNAKGLASILVYGGFQIYSVEEYKILKKHIKNLYTKRSKALHRAYWAEIDEVDVVNLANWSAWLIINVLALKVLLNYTKLKEIIEQAKRL